MDAPPGPRGLLDARPPAAYRQRPLFRALMNAAVLSIGTELTRGELIDRNAAWISERLTGLGCVVVEHMTVPDDLERIAAALRDLSRRARFVVATGGLGPTSDDLTSEAAALASGKPLVRHEPSLEAIRERYAAAGRELTPSSMVQADLPQGADVLPNSAGTAPGFGVAVGESRCFFMPGVTLEMKRMFDDHVVRRIAPEVERTSQQVRLRTFGLPESRVGELLEGVEAAHPGVTLGYRASFPEIEVKVLAEGDDDSSASAKVAPAVEEVRRRLGDAVFGEGTTTYPAYVGRILRDRRLTVALAESCTGGLAGSLITDVPGSSDYMLLSAVTYSNAAKTAVLGVSDELLRAYGAVSLECAEAMAVGARRISGADISVSITGIAGPGGGSEDKPVGTVFLAVAGAEGPARGERFHLSGDRRRIRTRAAYLALRLVAQAALG